MEISVPRPPWSALGRKLESACRKALYDFEMLNEGDSIALALSGGKDSLALLFLLKAIVGRGFADKKIHAIHVNGEYTCGAGVQLDYLHEICAALDVPLHVLQSTQKLETLECYSCSRERRSLLFNCAKSLGATTIAFGHHRDDNALTVMMNLFQKGEFCPMHAKVPMHDYGVTIIRPLIFISEEDVINFAKQHGFWRITCQCPVGQTSMRKTCAQLLNEIEQHYPNARANIASAGLVYGSEKALQGKKR